MQGCVGRRSEASLDATSTDPRSILRSALGQFSFPAASRGQPAGPRAAWPEARMTSLTRALLAAPSAGRLTKTSFEPTSRCANRPRGDQHPAGGDELLPAGGPAEHDRSAEVQVACSGPEEERLAFEQVHCGAVDDGARAVAGRALVGHRRRSSLQGGHEVVVRLWLGVVSLRARGGAAVWAAPPVGCVVV